IAPELERLGATKEFAGITDPGFTFTFIGSRGWRTGQAYQVGDPTPD
ncbi:MAG: hypothetical protein JO185_01680, partial [Acidobacteriaceae bacterium]|nr:hypothetical protein [Acidobacteriaceae bacterium]